MLMFESGSQVRQRQERMAWSVVSVPQTGGTESEGLAWPWAEALVWDSRKAY